MTNAVALENTDQKQFLKISQISFLRARADLLSLVLNSFTSVLCMLLQNAQLYLANRGAYDLILLGFYESTLLAVISSMISSELMNGLQQQRVVRVLSMHIVCLSASSGVV